MKNINYKALPALALIIVILGGSLRRMDTSWSTAAWIACMVAGAAILGLSFAKRSDPLPKARKLLLGISLASTLVIFLAHLL